MARVFVQDTELQDIADAIREKNGTEETYKPSEMGDAVRSIQSGGSVDESIWVEDNSEVVFEKACYQNINIHAFITENGTLTYKRIKDEYDDLYPKWIYQTDAQIIGGFGKDCKIWFSVEQAQVVNEEGYTGGKLITTLGDFTFSGLRKLKRIKLPKGITTLGRGVFFNCASLKKVTGLEDVTTMGNSCFDSSGIEEFDIPINVTELGSFAFSNCKSLKKISGIERITSLGTNCFDGCISLTGELVINEAIDTIQTSTFRYCQFDIVKFKGTPTSINSSSFGSCVNLTDIYVPWSEGEVANAPWGATNATIHYNTVYDENNEPMV